MAEKNDIDFSYTTMDKIWRLSVGEMADFTGAKYDGDFSLPLEDAQNKKHQFISENLRIGKGTRVLDMGCGWGPFLNHLRKIDAHGVGSHSRKASMQLVVAMDLKFILKTAAPLLQMTLGRLRPWFR